MSTSRKHASRVTRRLRRRGLHLALLAVGMVVLKAENCSKEDFYTPLTSQSQDVTSPLITSFLPVPGAILNDIVVMATITDPQGANGATPSGVDGSGIGASNSAELPITMSGTNMYNADISSLADGMHTIEWMALDLAGNLGTATQMITIDRTAPVVTVNPTPPATAESDADQFSWTVVINIDELHFLDGSYQVRLAGGDGECGTADDVTPTAQQVPTSTFALQEGSNSVEVLTNNGVPAGGQPTTAIYCGSITARDTAVLKTGGSASNTTTVPPFRTELTWLPPSSGGSFIVSLGNPAPGYCHIGSGDSRTYTGIGTSPAQPNASYTVVWSGPGTVGSTSRSGNLSAGGMVIDEQMINQFGTYPVTASVTAGGVTQMASSTVNVTSTQGACQQASSIRFKWGVMALLPADVRPLGLNPVAFRYVEPWGDPAIPRIGLIAEEVLEVFPKAVVLDGLGRPEAIVYGVLVEQVVTEGMVRTGRAVKAAIVRLADPLRE